MKVLFICRANVGRSQIAKALFNKLSKKHHAQSAGLSVDGYHGNTGQTLSEFATLRQHANNVIIVLKEEGIDVSDAKRTQLTPEMLKKFDKIIVIVKPEECPEWLLKNKKTIFWDVEDAAGTDYAFHVKTKDAIKKRVINLLNEIESN